MRLYQKQPSGTVARARDLRRHATEAEKRLFRTLREAFPALKWRRQVPIGPYFADLLSFGAKLVIEVDGGQHSEAQSHDGARTRFIEDEGYRVLRFWNNDVLANTDGVIAQISLSLRERTRGRPCPRHGLKSAGRFSPRAGAAQPRKGEGARPKEKGAPTFADAPSPFRPFGPPSLSQRERER